MFVHILSLFGAGIGASYLGGEVQPDYLHRLLMLFLILFPFALVVGFVSVWIVNKNAPEEDYQHSMAMSWLSGSLLVMLLSHADYWF